MGKTLACEHLLSHASFISLTLSFLLSLSLPFHEFCFAATDEMARPISASWVGEGIGHEAAVTSGLRLTLLAFLVHFVFVHPACWSVLGQYLSQAKPLESSLTGSWGSLTQLMACFFIHTFLALVWLAVYLSVLSVSR